MIKKRKQCDKIDWDNIEVVFTVADKKNLNPLNPNGKLRLKVRKKRIIDLASRIWRGTS